MGGTERGELQFPLHRYIENNWLNSHAKQKHTIFSEQSIL